MSVRKRPATAGLFSYGRASKRTFFARLYSLEWLFRGSGRGQNSLKNGNDDSPRTWGDSAQIASGEAGAVQTFLERLTESLVEIGWAEQANWDEELEALRVRRRETTKTTQPVLSPSGVLLAGSLLLTPFGVALLNAGLREGVTLAVGGAVNFMFVLGSVLTLAPLAVAVYLASKGFRSGRWRGMVLRLASLLLNKGVLHESSTSVEAPDRTSLEFEKHFVALMEEVLADGERRLILLIDNLDCVDHADAARIWSTLRTFLDHTASHNGSEWIKRLWITIHLALSR